MFEPRDYQRVAVDWILSHPRCGLFLDMGLGKTICTLYALDQLKYEYLEDSRTLVIAPLRVARTVWRQEAEKWGIGLSVAVAAGENGKRRLEILKEDADLHVINRELVPWLVHNVEWKWDNVVIDELSSFKSVSAQRFKALRKVIKKASRVIGLTGTPIPNGYLDLWSEISLLDSGNRLEPTLTAYKMKYFIPGGFQNRRWFLRTGADKVINESISDICLSMKKEDYLDMPDRVFIDTSVELPVEAMAAYKEMENELIIGLDGSLVTAASAEAASIKLQQISSGAVYGSEGEVVPVHNAKLEALDELIEGASSNVLVFAQFRHEIQRIVERYKGARELKSDADIADWNAGRIPVAVAHPASIGHGLNLQSGGHVIVWYGLTWNLELYSQANDRLYRRGQPYTVTVYHLIGRHTIDEVMLKALKRKESGQKKLLDWINEKRWNLVCQTRNECLKNIV